jgi:hypothetical protein
MSLKDQRHMLGLLTPPLCFPKRCLGLNEPTGYGWKTFEVEPFTGDLMPAKGTVDTLAGDITAAWEKSAGNHFTLRLTIPESWLFLT